MHVSFNLVADLDTALASAASAAGLADAAAFVPEVRTADPRHGDFQANGVLAFAKARKLNPRATAEQIVAALPSELRDTYDIAIAGPGFINFTLKPAALLAWLRAYDSEAHLREGAAAAHAAQTWVVDYSSPNTAKQMHVGHLRSAVIGEAICRLLGFTGARVIRDNHLGDWGTQFGKLIYGYKRWADPKALETDPIEELERLYKLGNDATPDGSPELEEAGIEPALQQTIELDLEQLQGGLLRQQREQIRAQIDEEFDAVGQHVELRKKMCARRIKRCAQLRFRSAELGVTCCPLPRHDGVFELPTVRR